MSCDVGLDNGVLSFQHIILPLLGLLTRMAITECILEKYVHAIFMVIYVNLSTYQQSIEQQVFASTDLLVNNLDIRKYFFMILEREMETMYKMLNNGHNNLIFGQNSNSKKSDANLTRLHYRELARKVDAERIYDPPGDLSKD
ncbi:hypothetical protein C1645_838336, partial [Glomus cerebriforme]